MEIIHSICFMEHKLWIVLWILNRPECLRNYIASVWMRSKPICYLIFHTYCSNLKTLECVIFLFLSSKNAKYGFTVLVAKSVSNQVLDKRIRHIYVDIKTPSLQKWWIWRKNCQFRNWNVPITLRVSGRHVVKLWFILFSQFNSKPF